MQIKIPVDAELYAAIIRDAGRHLRSADLHVVYLLRQAMSLEFPLPKEKPANVGSVPGCGASPEQLESVNHDARG
jgi:hypothetical protein